MGCRYKLPLAPFVCIILLMLTTQLSFVEKGALESENSDSGSNGIISNPTISPTLTTLRLANNTPMADITFSYTASSNGQVISPDNMSLLRDVSPGTSSSHPDEFAVLGNVLLFAASNGTVGEELWKTDGTPNGAVLVKDIRQGNLGSQMKHATTVGSTVFFRANDGINGAELWKTDGTTNGTVLVKDITSGENGSSLDNFVAVGNKLFFKADDKINGAEIWVSDGTPSGTFMVKDIRSGAAGSSIAYMTSFNDKAYFRAHDGPHGSEIWYSDGTENGTEIMMDLRPGSAGNSLSGLVSAGENLYFGARGDSGRGVFVSNGTANGTHQLTTSIMSDLGMYVAAGNNIFFKGNDGQGGGQELWFTNGTVNGTVELDILPGIDSENKTLESAPKWGIYHPHDGNLYFYANEYENGTTGYEFWKSDGTLNGTQIVNPGSTKPEWTAKQVSLLSAGRYVYYPIWGEGEDSRHLFRTDGTENGTIRLGEHSPDQYLTHPDSGSMAVIDGTFYATLGGGDSGNGYEIYYITNATGILVDATWSVYPTLPLGLSVDSITGKISGTPIAVQSSTQYTIWANTSLESASATVDIEIVGSPEFSYEPSEFNLVRLHEMPNMMPITMGGVVESWEIVPSLPMGLNFDLTNGKINGIPTVNQVTTTYSIWGNNSAGSYSFDVMIDVSEEAPNIVYQDPSRVATQYIRMDDMAPISNGGLIETWDISPQLPLGLFFNNGLITGTPAVNQSEVSYTVWANNSEGSDSDVITIEIQEPPPGIVMSQSELILVENTPMDSISLIYIGAHPFDSQRTWELDGDLPSGLMFEISNLTIYGTPTQIVNQINVTIWANTSLISDSVSVPINVLLDTDGDSMPDDFGALSPLFLVEDDDDDNDGLSDNDEQSSNPSTDSLLADTDGDGVCDGLVNVSYGENNICTSGYDYFPTDPAADADTDGDGYPDVIRSGYNTTLVEDDDDDGDGLSDVNESLMISQSSSLFADTDSDGICDGFIDVTIREEFICNAGPDAFPNDPSAYIDTDSDGKPDEIIGNSTTNLIEDLDDDGDQSSDVAEVENGTDPKNPLDFPTDDNDSDGWTNSQELFCGTDKEDGGSVPVDFDLDKWCDVDDPDDDNDGWNDDIESDCGTNPKDSSDTPKDDDLDGICNGLEVDGSFPWWIIPLLIFVPLIVGGFFRMGRLSKQMSEVIATSQLTDAADSVWDDETSGLD